MLGFMVENYSSDEYKTSTLCINLGREGGLETWGVTQVA